jgi:sugar phosphate isomerase/epimerase
MKLNRRELIKTGAASGLGLAAGLPVMAATPPSKGAKLKISSQDGVIPGKDLPEKLAKMEKWGFDGFEVWGSNLARRVPELQAAMKNTPLHIAAICAGYAGALISDQETERRKAVDTMKEILTAAGELGSTGLVIVPAFNGQTKLENREARKILIDILPEVGDHAAKAGTRVLMEPLNRGEAFFLRQLADAAAICRDVNNPGVRMMGDMYHMAIEETSDMGAFISAGSYLHHVHLASRKRNLPGQDDRDFTNGFAGLKMIGYQDFCSLECSPLGDKEVEIPKAVKFLRSQWAKA